MVISPSAHVDSGVIIIQLYVLIINFTTETTLPGILSSMSPTSASRTSVSPSPITDGNHVINFIVIKEALYS